ncbi:unnamed protein product [Clonostachys solani]|uniref:Uncharacterized protein n=1 Tax=Clonostachys solani TaxID=160281 RepID=A0A9N9ZBN0_9HYPO|nr:unnamed protein product [Clonostachys solani]
MSTSGDLRLRAPSLPTRSNMRNSKFLEPLISTKPGLVDEQPPLSPATAPHDMYLSSEEDASSSADDFSDYLSDFDSESSPASSPRTGHSHEDIAIVVNVVWQGKPSIIDLPRRSISPSSQLGPHDVQRVEIQKIQRTSTAPVGARGRLSIITTGPKLPSTRSSRSHTTTSIPSSKTQPSFLDSDPFSSTSFEATTPLDQERPRTPSMLKRMTLSRRRSRPFMSEAASQSQLSISTCSTPMHRPDDDEYSPMTPQSAKSFAYHDLAKVARRSMHFTKSSVPESPGVKTKLSLRFGRK